MSKSIPKPLPAPTEMESRSSSVEAKLVWTGRIVSFVPALMLGFSAAMKLTHATGIAEGFAHLGWSLEMVPSLAFLELSCAFIYLIPRSAVLGAVLITGLLGGAMATHIRVGDPTFVHIVLGVLVWGGLYLRDPRLRSLLPLRR